MLQTNKNYASLQRVLFMNYGDSNSEVFQPIVVVPIFRHNFKYVGTYLLLFSKTVAVTTHFVYNFFYNLLHVKINAVKPVTSDL